MVAHRVSLITVQAGAAKTVVLRDPERARRAMEEVENAGRQALGELRHLLDVLRPDADPGSLGPQPRLADVPRLVETLAEAGLDVALTMDPAPVALADRVDLSAYRIVQEALTSVIRHAGPGTQGPRRRRRAGQQPAPPHR
ncbi:MAG: histidine kinase, partial [Actinomycetota bacterium]